MGGCTIVFANTREAQRNELKACLRSSTFSVCICFAVAASIRNQSLGAVFHFRKPYVLSLIVLQAFLGVLSLPSCRAFISLKL